MLSVMNFNLMKSSVRVLIIATLLMFMNASKAQEIYQSVGYRFGGSGVAYKYIEDQFRGFELMLNFREHGIQFTGLLQEYKPVKTDRINNLYLFYGVGGHAGYKGSEIFITGDDGSGNCQCGTTYRYNPVIGIDGIVGWQYQFSSIPLTLSLDYKPYLEYLREHTLRLDLWDFGFTASYTF